MSSTRQPSAPIGEIGTSVAPSVEQLIARF
jgi:hypothetical protein